MKLSYEWLSEFVDLDGISPEEVAEKLTMNAFEVEDIEQVGANITGPLVVGKITEITQHPNADKIRVTKVLLEEGKEPVQIVCGAANIEVGHVIPVALPGAKVINRKDGTPLPIKASAIRGVESNGMLCSPSELGLTGYDADGILILSEVEELKDKGIKIGADAKEILGLTSDAVLNVGSRSNRGDALSVIGLAREVAALTGRKMTMPKSDLSAHGKQVTTDEAITTKIESGEDCPFLTIRYIEGLKVGPSPREIIRRLEAIGVRPVNNIVDITNYVMHEMGQPLHAYDVAQLKDKLIQVRRAKEGEALVTIDERDRKLTSEVMVIAGENDVLGVAGVMGGKGSEISDDTRAIALEAAAFSQARVRRGSRLLGLSSDASLRFERGVDVESVISASDRAATLIMQYCGTEGGAQYANLAQSGKATVEKTIVVVRMSRVKKLLDITLSAEEAGKLIEPLGFSFEAKGDQLSVHVPSFRSGDVTREIDVIEEIARIYGFDKLPSSMPSQTIAPPQADQTVNKVKQSLIAAGLSEAWISSLVRSESKRSKTETGQQSSYGLHSLEKEESLVAVLNPLSEDHEVLRQSLLPGLLTTASYNHDHGNKDVFLFEIGRSYLKKADINFEKNRGETGVTEKLKVGGILMGKRSATIWQSKPTSSQGPSKYELAQEEPHDFYRAKGVVEQLLTQAGVDMTRVKFFQSNRIPASFHPFRATEIGWSPNPNAFKGAPMTSLGFVGELHPGLSDEYKFSERASVFELDLDEIKKLVGNPVFKPLSAIQPVLRDLTCDVEESLDNASVESSIKASAGGTLKNLELVSLFQLGENKKSLSYRLTFLGDDEALTADEVDKRLLKIRESLATRLGATFRL